MQETIFDGLVQAFILLFTGDPEIWGVVLTSLRVSGLATVFAAFIGIPIALFIGINEFRGKRTIISFVNTGMGLPPVVVGLVVFLLLSNAGPLGFLDLLFTPSAMIVAQIIIATPIIAGVSIAAISSIDSTVIDTAKSLGAARRQTWGLILNESRIGIFSGVIIGFGQSISEVGASMLVGGNIKGSTRVLTTAIVLETRQGIYGVGIGLGIILILIAFIINSLILTRLQFSVKGTAHKKVATAGGLPV